jgi:hypothetical protein
MLLLRLLFRRPLFLSPRHFRMLYPLPRVAE